MELDKAVDCKADRRKTWFVGLYREQRTRPTSTRNKYLVESWASRGVKWNGMEWSHGSKLWTCRNNRVDEAAATRDLAILIDGLQQVTLPQGVRASQKHETQNSNRLNVFNGGKTKSHELEYVRITQSSSK